MLLWLMDRCADALLVGAGIQVAQGAEDQALWWILAAIVVRLMPRRMR